MDFGRSPYRCDCRFLRDNDIVGKVRWFEARPNAPVLDKVSIIYRREWDNDEYDPTPVGEVTGASKRFLPGFVPNGLPGNHVCGTDAEFELGGTYDPDAEPVRYNSEGWPLCCDPPLPVRGGAGSSGRAEIAVKRGLWVYGGAGSSGHTTFEMTGVIRTRGGAGSSGRCDVVTKGPIKVYGGAGIGGAALVNAFEETVFDVHGSYTFTPGVSRVYMVELWGAGCGGQTNVDFGTFGGGGGGGGGAYVRSLLALTGGTTYHFEVAEGTKFTSSGVGQNAPNSTWETTVMVAAGGHSGFLSNIGEGGRTVDCVGDFIRHGGDGASAVGQVSGGGGGGSAGVASFGMNAIGNAGGGPVPGGARGGDGSSSSNQWDGYAPGGGGGGSHVLPSPEGGDGADGKCVITNFLT